MICSSLNRDRFIVRPLSGGRTLPKPGGVCGAQVKIEDDPIKPAVKRFILEESLPGERPEALTDETALMAEGVLDSLMTLRLVSSLEKEFNVALAPREVDADYVNTLPSVAKLARTKIG
jgi:acyl carrier protein